MILHKSSKLAIAALLSIGMLTACNDDDPVNVIGVDGPGAYFSPTFSTSVNLSDDGTSFSVPLVRNETSGTLNVTISSTNPDDAFNIPTTVTFADGQAEANIEIGYVPTALVADQDYKIKLSLTEGYYNYADASMTVTATLPGHWTEWMDAPHTGYGDYTYSAFFNGVDPNLPVVYRVSNDDPAIEQWRIDDVMYGVSMYIERNAETNICHVPAVYTGYEHSNYGSVYATDVYTWRKMVGKDDADNYINMSTYDPETGVFSLYMQYFVNAGGFEPGYDYLQLKGFADYSMTLTQRGNYVEGNSEYAVVYAYMGADIESYKYTIATGDLSEAEINEVATELEADEDAEVKTESGFLAFPLEDAGKYTVVVAAYADGEVKTVESLVIKYQSVQGAEPWKDLGWVAYTDGYLGGLFGFDAPTYYVPVQESTEQAGLYRLVDAYGQYYPYNEEGDYNPNVTTYLYVNASDPDGVFVDYSESTTDWGYGAMDFWSMAGYYMENGGYSLDDVKNAGLCGVLDKGKIQFPVQSLAIVMGDKIYYGNTTEDETASVGPFCIDFNTLTANQPSEKPRKAAMLKSKKGGLKSNLKFKNNVRSHQKGVTLSAEKYLKSQISLQK